MKHRLLLSLILLSLLAHSQPQGQRLKVSASQRTLVHEDGSPFFYLGDTAWELFHRLTKEDAELYLQNRKDKGFTVIQAVVLAELDGLHTPNMYGFTPLINDNPLRPREQYFEHVDWVINKAAELGLYIALLPTWGDKVFKDRWGIGPEIFNVNTAMAYGEFIGKRYKDQWNIIWVLGGDRNPRNEEDVKVWRAMANGIVKGVGDNDNALMTFHPQPHNNGGSSTWFHHDAWLDFNMHQTGHCIDNRRADKITYDYNLIPVKPTMDGEPMYEEHPICFDGRKNGFSTADDIRKLAYWDLFAGAMGHTYGCHAIWQFYSENWEPLNSPQRTWKASLDLPGALQMGYLKNLMTPFLERDRIPDQSLVVGDNPKDSSYVAATRAVDGRFALVYTPTGKAISINAKSLRGKKLTATWFDPRTGNYTSILTSRKKSVMTFTPLSSGETLDWVLVLEMDKVF
ncbi:MAG TPA: glycoside hydrolase family 140 protein [Cyclobacteriaceae bacterium]|nr:glycoside hydrolase family 140 protein [Cyclobacteriaceae bacterium]